MLAAPEVASVSRGMDMCEQRGLLKSVEVDYSNCLPASLVMAWWQKIPLRQRELGGNKICKHTCWYLSLSGFAQAASSIGLMTRHRAEHTTNHVSIYNVLLLHKRKHNVRPLFICEHVGFTAGPQGRAAVLFSTLAFSACWGGGKKQNKVGACEATANQVLSQAWFTTRWRPPRSRLCRLNVKWLYVHTRVANRILLCLWPGAFYELMLTFYY